VAFSPARSRENSAKRITPDEILEIDPELVQESIGGLPQDQMHCARLSVEMPHAALEDYTQKVRGHAKERSFARPKS